MLDSMALAFSEKSLWTTIALVLLVYSVAAFRRWVTCSWPLAVIAVMGEQSSFTP